MTTWAVFHIMGVDYDRREGMVAPMAVGGKRHRPVRPAGKKNRLFLANLAGAAIVLFLILAIAGNLITSGVLWLLYGKMVPDTAQSIAGLVLVPVCFLPPVLMAGARGTAAGLRVHFGRGSIPVLVLLPLFLGIMVAVNSASTLLRDLFAGPLGLEAAQMALLPQSISAKVVYFFTACVVAPVMEELFFRGVVQGALRPWGQLRAILLTSLLFMLAHQNLWELPTVFVLGFIIGYIGEVSGSLLPCILLHAANNTVMFILMLQQERLGGVAALAFALWLILLLVALFAAAVYAVWRLKLLSKFKLQQPRLPKEGRAAGSKIKKSAILRLANARVLMFGIVAMVAYCLIRLLM